MAARGFDTGQINICNYISLNNEITIPDIAEGLARATADLKFAPDEPFDAIVHSTGMLVMRAYLCNNTRRPHNLKHLVGLAPATWGSPLAHEGRSFIGALFKGNHQLGPDFLNSGDLILDALELGSEFTWNLAHRDLLGDNPLFTNGPDSPYVAVFIGNQGYTGIRELVNTPGMDGTVRWAGCGLNTRKIVVDLLRDTPDEDRTSMLPWAEGRQSIPMFAVEGKNHGTLLSAPEDDLADKIAAFLKISAEDQFEAWRQSTLAWSAPALAKMKHDQHGDHDGWQQFVVHVVDEYGNPVPDYVVDLFTANPTGLSSDDLQAIAINDFDLDVHAYQTDHSFRCFHVRLPLGITTDGLEGLWLRLTASSGTALIAYQGYNSASTTITQVSPVVLDISPVSSGADSLFCPFTTTLVEIRIHREPLPFSGQSQLMTMAAFSPR